MNAFTSKEYTCFYARVIDTDLPMAIDVVSDLITSSIVSALDVDAERKVVLEEIAMRDDDPSDLVHDLYAETYYGDTHFGASNSWVLLNRFPKCPAAASLTITRRSTCHRI
jgi:predicted Zn-dependent peptidase